MPTFHENMEQYRLQLQKGDIQQAYRGLMRYILDLKAHFKRIYPAYAVSSSLYAGYLDMTCFYLFPPALKERNLKIAVVFLHEAFRFEAWLSGVNRQAQQEYWRLFKQSGWDKYRIVPTLKGVDSIVEHILVAEPDFNHLDTLTASIEAECLKFIRDLEAYLTSI